MLLPSSVPLPTSQGPLPPTAIVAWYHRDGMYITLCVTKHTYFSFDETVVLAMPPGQDRWKNLVGRRFSSFAQAAQETHSSVFGARCNYMRDFYVWIVPHSVDPRLSSDLFMGSTRQTCILAIEPHIDAHVCSRVEARPARDVYGRWWPIGALRPAISLERAEHAATELKAMAAREHEQTRSTLARTGHGNGAKLPMHERERLRKLSGESSSAAAPVSQPTALAGPHLVADVLATAAPRPPPQVSMSGAKRPAEAALAAAAPRPPQASASGAKKPKYRLTFKNGTIVWERNLDIAIKEGRAPRAFIVCDSRMEQRRVAGESPKVLLVKPLDAPSTEEGSWVHAADLAPIEEQLPRIWHARANEPSLRVATEAAVARAFAEHHRDHGTHLDAAAMWASLMRTAGQPTELPAFLLSGMATALEPD